MSAYIVDRINKVYKSPVNILFDECHGESWSISIDVARQINPMNINNCSYESVAKILRQEKFHVERLSSGPINIRKLGNCDIFVIVHPTDGKVCKNTKGIPFFSESEINDLVKWVSGGGSLFVLYEYETNKWGSNINSLLEKFDISYENNILIDRYRNIDNNPSTVSFNNIASGHKILEGVTQVIYYAGSTIKVDGTATGVLISSQDSEPPCSPVIACNEFHKGRIVAIGDTDLFDPVRIYDADHATLLKNIFCWLSANKPSIMIEQDMKLFSDHRVKIDWEIRNISETFIDTINITDNVTDKSYSLSRLSPDETRTMQSEYIPQQNSIIPIAGKCKIDYSYSDWAGKSFDIEGAKMQLDRHSDKSTFKYELKNDFHRMPLCPLNYRMCTLSSDISGKHRIYKVFLDIPYGEEYNPYKKAIYETLYENNLLPVIAKDNSSGKILLCNICEEIQSCAYAIADINGFRGNILYELGLIHALGKRCAILKPKSYDGSLGDITGITFMDYETPQNIKDNLNNWIKQEIFLKEKERLHT